MRQLISSLLTAHCSVITAHCSLLTELGLPGDRLNLDSSGSQRCGSGIDVFGGWAWPGKQCDAADMHASSSSGCKHNTQSFTAGPKLGHRASVRSSLCCLACLVRLVCVVQVGRWHLHRLNEQGQQYIKESIHIECCSIIGRCTMLWSTCLCDLCIDSYS